MAGFSLLNGVFISFTVILSPLFEPYGYSPQIIATMGGIFIIVGVMSSIVFGIIIDKHPYYLLTYKIICIGTTVTFALMLLTFPTSNSWLVGVNVAFAGALLVPIMPVGIGFACELTFPMEATLTNGMLQMFA